MTRLPRTVACVVWALALASLYHLRFADPDLWWLLRGGRDIIHSGHVLQADAYSFTAAGLVQVNGEWLTQVLLWVTFANGGALALIVFKMAAGVTVAVLLNRLLRLHTPDDRIRLPALLLGAHAVGRFLLFRPQALSFVFLAALLLCLERHRMQHGHRTIWVMPALFCLWANMHTGFVAGLFLLAYYALAMPLVEDPRCPRFRRDLTVVFALSTVATLLTPFGPSLWRTIIVEILDPLNKRYVQEWLPPTLWPPDWNGAVFLLTLALTLASAAACRPRERGDLLLFGIFALAAGWSMRHIPLFALVAVMLLAKWTNRWATRTGNLHRQRLVLASGTAAVALPAVLTLALVIADPAPRIRILDAHYKGFPYEAVEILRQQPSGGHVWTELGWGGYALWRLSPPWRVSIDGRNTTLYPREVVRDHLELFAAERPDLATLQRYPIDVCLIDPYSGLAAALEADARWETVYRDTRAVIFRHRGSTRVLPIPRGGIRIPRRPTPLLFDRAYNDQPAR